MACCSEFQTECLKVVTIGYLNSFIGNNIKDTSGNVRKAAGRDDYCPTYGELTGGSLIPNWSQGSSPYLDIDGIYITGSYAGNQLVKQEDLQAKFTTFKTLTISRSGSGDLSACGADATLGYTYEYERHVKSMNSSCSSSESKETITGKCGELSYHTTYGTVSDCTSYHIDKNGAFSGPSDNRIPTAPGRRCDTVYADVTFRGEYKKSNELSICQSSLTGYWSTRDNREFKSFSVEGHPQNGGTVYSCSLYYVWITGTATYIDWYHWIDNCGTHYPNIRSGITTTEGCDSKYCDVSGPNSVNCEGTANFSFTSGASSVICDDYYLGWNWDCCDGRKTETKTLSKTFGGQTGSVTWTWICQSCASCANCADASSSTWGCSRCAETLGCSKCAEQLGCSKCAEKLGCSKCAEELGCDKCADELGCDKCAKELGCDKCPDGPDCGDDGE